MAGQCVHWGAALQCVHWGVARSARLWLQGWVGGDGTRLEREGPRLSGLAAPEEAPLPPKL